MKNLAILLILLLVPLAIGTDFENLKPGDEIEDEGWHVKLLKVVDEDTALFQVYIEPDNVITRSAELGEQKLYDGIFLNVTDLFYDENPEMSFIDLATDAWIVANCDNDSDCDDFDSCTIDQCIGYPKRCDYEYSHINITQCISGDSCCPSGCYRLGTDSDCDNWCYHNGQCNDYNDLTNNTCNTAKHKCEYYEITVCETGDSLCPNNCTYTLLNLENRDNDCSPDSECISHADCDDNNASTLENCTAVPSTEPKKCVYENATYWLKEAPVMDTPYKDKTKYTYNEPLEATKEQIDEILKQPYSKAVIISLSAVLAIAAYYFLVLSKFKPEVEKYSPHLKKP